MDYTILAQDLIRAIRSHRSQRAFSRRLGYSTNVLYTWESGRRAPTAAETFRVAMRAGIDVSSSIRRFVDLPDPDAIDLKTADGVAAFLRILAGDATVAELGRRSGLGRYRVGRWLSAQTEPRLPEFLQLVDAITLRLLDLIAVLIDPLALPSAAEAWKRVEARRRLAQVVPWSHAVVRTLEIAEYRALPAHRPGWIASRLGISVEEEARCLETLEEAGEIKWHRDRYRPQVATVDTRLDPAAGGTMRRHWLSVADERLAEGATGQFSYNVFACSRADFERLREMHLTYFRALRQVVAASVDSEIVAVANVQLFEISDHTVPALDSDRPGLEKLVHRER